MAAAVGLGEYKKVQVVTSDQSRLVVMLYEAAIRHLEMAKDCLRKGDWIGKGEHILRAQDILMELLGALDLEAGPIAKNLNSLYLFMYRHLNEANLHKSERHVDQVLRILSTLCEAWKEAASKITREGVPEAEVGQATIVA
ncbi:MAG: flagellar export chaperone FliS [candidate division KSB1 bacterium]|nr:flagellar export chaperone FliS [candidate division KSB1 bacterium]